jgi:hypothetical protein
VTSLVTGESVRNLVENHVTNLILGQQHRVVARQGNLAGNVLPVDDEIVRGTKPTLTAVECELQVPDAMLGHEVASHALCFFKFHGYSVHE